MGRKRPSRSEVAVAADAAAAALARRDFNAFVEYVGKDRRGLPIRQHPLHEIMWEFADEAAARDLFYAAMLPMGHGKTTQCCYRAAWEIGRDHNLIGVIVTDNDPNAVLRQELVRTIMATPEYRRVFPTVKIAEGKDTKGAFTLERTGHSKDATLDSMGVLSGVGARAKLIMLDDVVTLRNALFMPADRLKVYDAIRSTWSSRPVLGEEEPNRVIWIQTAYHEDDAASRIRKDPDSGWLYLVVRAEEPYEDLAAEVWYGGRVRAKFRIPNFHGAEELRQMAARMGPTHAARGLANRPLSGEEQPFKEEHFEGPPPLALDKYRRRCMAADPAGDATKTRTGEPDWCAVALVGQRSDGGWEVLRSERIRASPSMQVAFIAQKIKEWRPARFWLEVITDASLPKLIKDECARIGAPVVLEEFKPVTHKVYRIIEILEPALSSGDLSCDGETFEALRAEALSFPAGAHDDLLDSLASAYKLAQEGGQAHIADAGKTGGHFIRPRKPIGRVPLWERGR